jgi:hypothetical protein
MLYRAWRESMFSLITSLAQLEEIERVLSYKKLERFIDPHESATLLNTVHVSAQVLRSIPTVNFSPDPDDNKIIATAIAGKADYLVSGDKADLLALRVVQNIPIISARQAVKLLSIAT